MKMMIGKKIKKRVLNSLLLFNIIFMKITIPVSNLTPEQAKDLINKMRKSYWFPFTRQEKRAEKIKNLLQKIS